jgi:hypothetical protein
MNLFELFLNYWLSVFGNASLDTFSGSFAYSLSIISVIFLVAFMFRIVLYVFKSIAGLIKIS